MLRKASLWTWGAVVCSAAGLLVLAAVLVAGCVMRTSSSSPIRMQVSDGHWVAQAPHGKLPGERYGYGGGYDPVGHQVVIYGDWSGGQDLGNYLAAYQTEQNRWIEVSAKGGWPKKRDGAAVMFDPGDRRLIIFGGWDTDGNPLGDTWAYDLEGQRWSQLKPAGVQPQPRCAAGVAYDAQHGVGFLYGGTGEDARGDKEILGDLWTYDARANMWTELRPSGEIPSARGTTTMVFDSGASRLILMFGIGPVGSGLLGDMWSYNIATNRWTQLSPKGDCPSPRVGSATAYCEAGNQIILFGGLDEIDDHNDTWMLDLGPDRWVRLPYEGGDVPTPRDGSVVFLDTDCQAVILFGGYGEHHDVLSDLWTYKLGDLANPTH